MSQENKPDGIVWDRPPSSESIKWDAPDDVAETLKKLLKTAGKTVVTTGKNVGRGFLSGLAALGEGAAAVSEQGMGKPSKAKTDPQQDILRLLPVPKDETSLEKVWRKGTEGIGGAMALPIPGAGVLPMLAAGFGGGVGSDLGERVGEKAGFPKTGAALGGLVGGVIPAFASGPRLSVAAQDVRRELPNPQSTAWRAAEDNARTFEQAGATSATAADLFPGQPRILGLAANSANTKGGELLADRLSGRVDDLVSLGEKFITNIGPKAEIATVANKIADAANSYLKGQKQLSSTALRNRLAGEQLTPQQARELYDSLLAAADMIVRNGGEALVANGYREVAKGLISADPNQILRSVQDLSFKIKSFKDAAGNPLKAVADAPSINAGFAKDAVKDAEVKLGVMSPTWEDAMKDYGAARAKNLETGYRGDKASFADLLEGPFGRLADRNPILESATPFSRVGAIVEGRAPETIKKTLNVLADPKLTASVDSMGRNISPTVSRQEIASALAQQKIGARNTNPGASIEKGVGGKENLMALLGPDAANITAPLRAADQLQGLHAATQIGGLPEMHLSNWIRPFRAFDMLTSGMTQEAVNREVARLLLNPKNLPELQKIAQFDPSVRKALTLNSAIMPALGTGLARPEQE